MGRPPLVSREEIIAAARDVFLKEGHHGVDPRRRSGRRHLGGGDLQALFRPKAALIVRRHGAAKAGHRRNCWPPAAERRPPHRANRDDGEHRFILPRAASRSTLPIAMQPDVGLAAYVDEVGDNPPTACTAALAAQLATAANSGRLRKLQPFAVAA